MAMERWMKTHEITQTRGKNRTPSNSQFDGPLGGSVIFFAKKARVVKGLQGHFHQAANALSVCR